jgi:hypothetical protein
MAGEVRLGDEVASHHTWLVSTLFMISAVMSIYRPDPTPAISMIIFYATAHRSAPAVYAFGILLALSLAVDVVWFVEYSPLQVLTLDALLVLSQPGQLALTFTAVSVAYKLAVLYASPGLYRAFAAEAAAQATADALAAAARARALAPAAAGEDRVRRARCLPYCASGLRAATRRSAEPS